jgi:hypothetical protein
MNQFDAVRDEEEMTMAPQIINDTSAEAYEEERIPLTLYRTMLDGATGWAVQWYQGQSRNEARVWWVRQNQSSTTYAASFSSSHGTYTTWGSLDHCTTWLERLSARQVRCE